MNEMFIKYSKLLDDTEQHLSNESLAIYANLKEQLSVKERSFVENHIQNCGSCKEKLDIIVEEDKEIDPGNLSGTKIFRIPQFVKYAVAASLIIAIGAIFYLSNIYQPVNNIIVDNKVGEERIDEQVRDTVEIAMEEIEELDKKIKEELHVDNQELFAVNMVLENFLERNLRSDTKLRILMPKVDDIINFPQKFEWERFDFDEEVEFEIVDNKNKKLFSSFVNGESIIIDEDLGKGLYYWKIKADGRLEDIGKFKIM